MKRRDFLVILSRNGWSLKRTGANHDVWSNGKSTEMVPRHRELSEALVKAIIKRKGLK